MRRRYTTRKEDAAFIMNRLAEMNRSWQVGDATLPYKTCNAATTIVRFDGDTVVLADGTEMHRSHLRRPVTK
jgi:hypothetical protein